MTVDNVVEMKSVGDDAEKIQAVRKDSFSDFEEITVISNPPHTILPIRRSQKLNEKRGGQDCQIG